MSERAYRMPNNDVLFVIETRETVSFVVSGVALGTLVGMDAQHEGREFHVPGGGVLRAQRLGLQGWHLLFNGKHLPGSSGAPGARIEKAWAGLVALGMLSMWSGMRTLDGPLTKNVTSGLVSIGFGLLFFALYFSVRRASRIGIWAAMAVIVADNTMWFVFPERLYAGWLLLASATAITWLVQSVGAVRVLEAER